MRRRGGIRRPRGTPSSACARAVQRPAGRPRRCGRARAAPRRAAAARARRRGARPSTRCPSRQTQSPSRQPVTSTPSAPLRSAYSTNDGGSCAAHSSVSRGGVRRAQRDDVDRRRRSRRRRCAGDDVAAARRDATMRASSRSSVARAAPIGVCGRSMPVTSSATDRNGVDDGQAPAQMPQPAHRSASTLGLERHAGVPSVRGTHRRPRRTGSRRSSARSRCSWRARRRRRRGRGSRAARDSLGQRSSSSVNAAGGRPTARRRRRVGERVRAEVEPVERECAGVRRASAGASLVTGTRERQQRRARRACPTRARAAAASPAATAAARAPTSAPAVASGMPMCRKISSEKSRSLTAPSAMKLRISAPSNSGSASSHSVVAIRLYCASRSHTSQKPPMPDANTSHSATTPVSHENRLEVRVAADAAIRARGAASATSDERVGRVAMQAPRERPDSGKRSTTGARPTRRRRRPACRTPCRRRCRSPRRSRTGTRRARRAAARGWRARRKPRRSTYRRGRTARGQASARARARARPRRPSAERCPAPPACGKCTAGPGERRFDLR